MNTSIILLAGACNWKANLAASSLSVAGGDGIVHKLASADLLDVAGTKAPRLHEVIK
jgi:hypothetical protein